MGGKITAALSPETRALLKQNKFFYDSVLELVQQTKLELKTRDGEAKTEIEQLSDGNLAVHVLLPIDGNGQGSDGRIYLRDTFIFDAKQKQLHSHKRSFEYNGRGENKAEWQKWLEQYKAALVPTGDAMQAFAASAARSFSRPFQSKHPEIFTKNNEFYAALRSAGKEQGLSPKLKDSRSSYAIVHRGLVTEIVFNIAMLDTEGKAGHLNIKETFVLDGNTQAVVGYKRHVEVPAETPDAKAWQAKADALNAVTPPNVEAARHFIGNFLPDILSDIPEFKPETIEPPVGGYPEMTPAMFQKTMGAIGRVQRAAPIAKMDPEFFKALEHSSAYLEPLRQAMGAGFELNLKDPPLQTSVQVQKGKTQVFMTYSLRPKSGETGVLEYSERWTFENGQLTAVDRQAKALGTPSGGEVEAAALRAKEAIQGGKFGDAKDKATYNAIVSQVGYLAPHLGYVGLPNLVQQNPEQANMTQQMVVKLLQDVQSDLVAVQYQNEVDPAFREDLLRLNGAMIYGDQETQQKSLQRLQLREEEAVKTAKDPEQKQRHQENQTLASLLLLIHAGEIEKAYQTSKSFVSPAYKKVFAKHLELNFRVGQLTEGMALISKVVEDQIDVGQKQGKGWFADSPKYSPAEKDAIKGLLFKSLMTVEKTKSGDAMIAIQAALDFGKDKKPEEMKDEEKKLLLTETERAIATKILADPLVKRLANIALEEDTELQAKEYFELARGKLFERGLVQTSHFLIQSVVVQKMPKNGTSESIDILRSYAMEKSENAKLAKIQAMPQPPQELKALESLVKKVDAKAQENPALPILTVLSGLTGLTEDEQKLVVRLQKSPTLKKISEAAALPTVKQRLEVYQNVVQPFLTDQLLLDDVIAQLEKDPKLGLKQAFEKIPDLQPAQAQLLQLLDQNQLLPKVDQALAAGVSMNPTERAAFYRKTLTQYLPNLMTAQKVEEALTPISKLEDNSQFQAMEGTTLIPFALGLELEAEMLPQTKLAVAYDRANREEHKTIQSLLDKAAAKSPMNPSASAYAILGELKDEDLSPAEKELRTRLLGDKAISAILEIGAEPDIVKRREAYLAHLPNLEKQPPESGTLGKAGFHQADMWLAQNVLTGKIPDIRGYVEMPALVRGQQPDRRHFAAAGAMESQEKMTRDVKKFLAVLEGKGDFGSKFGYGLPHFTKELTKPTSIAAMMAAPLVGGATSLAVFSKLRNLGMFGKGVAVVAGVGAEATTFTYLHAKGEKYAYGNEAPDKTFWNDVKSNALLFGAMRGVHIGTSALGQKVLATGKVGKWAGSNVAGETNGAFSTLPTKELVWMPSGGGVGVPQLTVAGERVVGILNHGGAVASMYGAGKLSHKLGWQAQAPGLDDTLLMYMQAMAGYSLANSATGGRLSTGIAGLKMRMDNVNGSHTVAGVKEQIATLKAEKAKFEADKASLNDAAKREVDGKIHGIDGKVLKLEAKLGRMESSGKKTAGTGAQGDLIQLFEPKLEEISLDALLLGKAGSEIVVKRDAEGKHTLHNNQKADAPADATGQAPPLPTIILHNGKTVTEPVVLAEGDVLSIGGKQINIGISDASPLQAAMAKVPRSQQLSLAGQIAKAKKIPQLFKILRDSPYGGAGEVTVIVAEVLAGRRSLNSLPTELNIKSKVEALLEGQVKEWKKSGLSSEGYALKEGALPKDAAALETEYHTLRALTALSAGVEGSRTLYDLLQAMGQSSLQTIGGVSTKQIFDSLGLESQRGLLEQATKTEAGLREKIQLAQRAITREKKAWRKTDKDMVESQEKIRDELTEKADGLKQLIDLLKAEVEAGDAAVQATQGRKLPEIIGDLPRELGIRQKAKDAVEQSQGDFAKSLSEKDTKDFLEIAKRYLGAGEIEFGQAQSLLRSLWDTGHWQGKLLLRRLKPEQLELAFKIYFGADTSRNLSPEQAFHFTEALAQTPLKASVKVVLTHGEGPARLDLVRDGGPGAKDGEVVLLQTPATKTKDIAIIREELVALGDQAKSTWHSQPGGSAVKTTVAKQLSDSQLFFDPETRSFQTWVSHPRGLAKVRITLDPTGEIEAVQIKYALRPGHGQQIGLILPENFKEWTGKDGEPIAVEKQLVDYQALAKELPFEQKGPSLTYRALQKTAWIGDRMPSLPKLPSLPKWGGTKPDATPKTEPAAEAKTDASTSEAKADPAPKPKKKKSSGPKGGSSGSTPPPADGADAKPKGSSASFFSGPMGWFRAKFPKAVPVKPVAKVGPRARAAKAPQSEVVSPPVAPPKAEGSRPTLPNDLKFPPSQIGMGERGAEFSSLEISQSANSLMGEYAGRTHEGVGRQRNEDGIGMAYTRERDLVLVAVDGMGGHENGKEAARITLETLTESVQSKDSVYDGLIEAHDKVVRDLHPGSSKAPGAGVGVVKIRRPDSLDGPYSMEATWGGDVSIVLLRKGADGKRRLIYRNAEDNRAREYIDAVIESGMIPKERRDLAIISNGNANIVSNVVGASQGGFIPRRTGEGYIADATGQLQPAKGLDRIAIETGDVVLVIPDGTSKNLKDPQVLIDLLEGKESAAEIAKTIDEWVVPRMEAVDKVDKRYDDGTIPDDKRQSLNVDGTTRFIDRRGNVYESPEGGEAIDHYEADNFSAMVYVHNPEIAAKGKK